MLKVLKDSLLSPQRFLKMKLVLQSCIDIFVSNQVRNCEVKGIEQFVDSRKLVNKEVYTVLTKTHKHKSQHINAECYTSKADNNNASK